MIDDRRMRPTELIDGEAGRDLDVAAAYAVARALERSLETTADVRPSDGFTGLVMAAIAAEPAPAQTSFLEPLRAYGLGGLAASIRGARRVATEASLGPRRRATALAYLLAIVLLGSSALGAAGYGAAGALGILPAPAISPSPSTPQVPGPTGVPIPSVLPSSEPAESDDPSLEPGETREPGDTAEPADDDGGSTQSPDSDG